MNIKIYVVSILMLISSVCLAEPDSLQKEKGQFMLDITRYLRWNNMSDIGKTFDIAVVRSKGMAKQLVELSKNKTILGKKIKIVEYYKLDEIEECDIVFLSSKVYINDNTISIVKSKVHKSTLIITDDAPRVGMINFFTRTYGNMLTYEVNKINVENANITLSKGFLKSEKTTLKKD